MAITTEMVKKLRAATGAGVLDCKKALQENDGNFDKAVETLRQKGLAKAAKKASRAANEGLIGHYIHMGAKVAALVEVNCETDFVARTDEFQELARDLAMQVVAAKPLYLKQDEVPADVLAHGRSLYRALHETSMAATIRLADRRTRRPAGRVLGHARRGLHPHRTPRLWTDPVQTRPARKARPDAPSVARPHPQAC